MTRPDAQNTLSDERDTGSAPGAEHDQQDGAELSEKPLYNSRITDSYLRLIKKRYSYVDISTLLDYAGMKDYEVADQSHWFTQEQVNRFQEKLVQMTGNPKIAREAGRYTASVDALGVMRQYMLGLMGVSHAFQLISKTTSKLTRSSVYEYRRISDSKVEIIVTPRVEGLERPFQCENRTGFFEATFLIFNNKMPVIEHPECMFAGGKVCRYVVPLEKTTGQILKQVRRVSTLGIVLWNICLAVVGTYGQIEKSLYLSVFVYLILIVLIEKSEKRELKASLSNSVETSDNLLEQLSINYNNALMTNEIGQGLGSYSSTEEILGYLIKIMQKRLSYDRCIIFLADSNQSKLELQTGYGYSENQISRYDRLCFHLNRRRSRGVFVRSFREQRPFLINDVNEIRDSLSARSLAFARAMGAVSFICCPIICEKKSMGILAVDNVTTKQPLVESDISLLMGLASVIGISIRNAELMESRVRAFRSILQALAASIDARDPLTAGHSEKVTEYSIGICKELGLHPDYCEMIRVAALLHDYGKIGVPDTILKKQGRLTSEEYEVVKGHAGKTMEILGKINFEGIFKEVPDIAGSHHEKVDGTGYPRGRKGAEIPLGARIIAVADYFEAITAKRHYRDPMPLAEALEVLREAAGAHLELALVEALISYYSRTYPEAFRWQEYHVRWGQEEKRGDTDQNVTEWTVVQNRVGGVESDASATGAG